MSLGLRAIRGTNVTLYPGEPTAFIVEVNGPVVRDLERRMTRAQLAAKRTVRKRTGKLAGTIRKNTGYRKRSPYVDVIAGAPRMKYTGFEEFGTEPHIITVRRKRKKALRFEVGGTVMFRRSVRHPGTKGSHFLEFALFAAGG